MQSSRVLVSFLGRDGHGHEATQPVPQHLSFYGRGNFLYGWLDVNKHSTRVLILLKVLNCDELPLFQPLSFTSDAIQ
jgi:hypothetical protein